MTTPQQILNFWFSPSQDGIYHYRPQWFVKSSHFDEEVRQNFLQVYEDVVKGHYKDWENNAEGLLALILVQDQFPRNMFRNSAKAFATDGQALRLTRKAIREEIDHQLNPVQRWFLYMPLEHSENLQDQEISVEIFAELQTHIPESQILDYAQRHRDVIARFGRFPHRNEILGRKSTVEELEYLRLNGGF